MAKKKGREIKIYLSASAPQDKWDVTDYDAVAYVTQITDNITRNAINESDADSGNDSDYQAGRRDADVQITAHYDVAEDAGQDAAWTAIKDDTAGGGKVHALITSNVAGDREDALVGIVTGVNRTYSDEGIATLAIAIKQSGERYEQVVAS